jgi:hypothetical protein
MIMATLPARRWCNGALGGTSWRIGLIFQFGSWFPRALARVNQDRTQGLRAQADAHRPVITERLAESSHLHLVVMYPSLADTGHGQPHMTLSRYPHQGADLFKRRVTA